MPIFNYHGHRRGLLVEGWTPEVADRAAAVRQLEADGIKISRLTLVAPPEPEPAPMMEDAPAPLPPGAVLLWIGSLSGSMRHLESMGVKIGSFNAKLQQFERCVVDAAAMARLDECWGTYIWGTYASPAA